MDQDQEPTSPACTEKSRVNGTVGEVSDASPEAEGFVSVVDSQIAITFDVNSSMDMSLEDKTQYSSQIESLVNEESINLPETTALDVSASVIPSGDNSETEKDLDNSITIVQDRTPYFECKILELGRYLWPTDAQKQCYTKGCLWSPDGTCCLVPVHMDGMHLIELPADLYAGNVSKSRQLTRLSSAVHVREGGTVYDCAWYPFMNSSAPETCCWLASRQHEPIHMWDAFNGDLRATYRGYDDVDEVEAAICVTFSCDGQQVLGGYKKCIRIFDTDIPGRNSTKLVTKQAISCFALSNTSTDIVTTGSWNGVINLYDKRVTNIGSLSSLFGHTGGITFLKYSNCGQMLFSGARKDNNLCLWDMRNFTEPVAVLNRTVSTNQRIYFDICPQNEWLISGDTTGLMRIWNLQNIEQKRAFRLHGDSCNGVSFHPSKPIIATSAGQYHFLNSVEEAEETIVEYENSLVFWWIGSREEE